MARKERTVYEITDDLTGEAIREDDAVTIEFSYGGQAYTIDLDKGNAKTLDDFMAKYVDAATPIRKKSSTSPLFQKTTPPKFDRAKLTAWAEANGYKVAPRGRISGSVIDAYLTKDIKPKG
nr:Lsr2 family protein [Microbacterium lemovicicum]